MKEIDELLVVVDHLLGPEGCPWDRVQTMVSVREHVLEEVSELIEAIDLQDNEHIKEELGDLFFNAIFLSRLAEKEQRFSLKDVVKDVTEKLVRRHPHVFGENEIETVDELYHQWEAIKQVEKGKEKRESVLDGIPKTLPPLARAQKVIKKLKKRNYQIDSKDLTGIAFSNEEELGEILWAIAERAQELNIESEQALRAALARKERDFRISEAAK